MGYFGNSDGAGRVISGFNTIPDELKDACYKGS